MSIKDKITGTHPMGPVQVGGDVLDVLSEAQRNEDAAKKAQREYKQRQKANRKLRKSAKKAKKAAGIQAARAAGYDGMMLLFNEKGQGVPVIFDETVRIPQARTPNARTTKTHWELPDCKVDMIEWIGPLKAFRVQMGNKLQTVVPDSLKDMQDCIMALEMNISPVGLWQDGAGNLVCPENAVPKNGPAPKKKKTTKPTVKTSSSACIKKKTNGTASKPKSKASAGGAKKTQSSQCIKKKTNGTASKPKTKASGTAKGRTGSAQRRPTTSPNRRTGGRR